MTSLPLPALLARLASSDAESTADIAAALLRDAADSDLTLAIPILKEAIHRWESRSHHNVTCHSAEVAAAQRAERAARALCDVVIAHGLFRQDAALLEAVLLSTEHGYAPNLFVSSTIALSGRGYDISPALAVLTALLSAHDPAAAIQAARIFDTLAGTPPRAQRDFMARLDPLLPPAMRALLTDSPERVRRSLSQLLASRYTHHASWSDLAALLDSPDVAVRFGATRSLRNAPLIEQDISPVLPRLHELCSDPDRAVVDNATRAIDYAEKYRRPPHER
jgi:hypothetical protein